MESHTRVGGHIVAGGIPGESGIISTRTSCCSHSTMPTKRIAAARFGKMPTTSVRRRISLFSRSCALVDQISASMCQVGMLRPPGAACRRRRKAAASGNAWPLAGSCPPPACGRGRR